MLFLICARSALAFRFAELEAGAKRRNKGASRLREVRWHDTHEHQRNSEAAAAIAKGCDKRVLGDSTYVFTARRKFKVSCAFRFNLFTAVVVCVEPRDDWINL